MHTAFTRPVSSSINSCELTHRNRTPIDVALAIAQHQAYEQCLQGLRCQLRRLPAMPDFPDAVFVEDTCIVFDELAVITRPGAASRRPETASMADAMKSYRPLQWIESPGTLDGGDVLCVGRRIYVGQSSRTNGQGIERLRTLLTPHGHSVTAVELSGCLHLKSAATVVADGTVLVNPEWVDPAAFGDVTIVRTDPGEPMAANALRIGNRVVYAAGFPKTQRRLEDAGIEVVIVDLSELAKAEGAVTCCSVVVGVVAR